MKIKPSRLHKKMTVENSSQQSTSLNKAKKPGLTLVEVIISVALLAILSVPVSGFVNSSIQMNKKAEVKQQATLLAQQVFEELGSKKSLMIGENSGLFGQTGEVQVIACATAETCDYAIKNLDFDNMLVDLEFTKLVKDSGTLGLSGEDEDELIGRAKDYPDDTGIYFNLTGGKVSVSIVSSGKTINLGKLDSSTIEIDISAEGEVKVKIGSLTHTLIGKLDPYNLYFNVQNNNANGNGKDPLKNLVITNNSINPLKVCIFDKDPDSHGKVSVNEDGVKIIKTCNFNGEPGDPETPGEVPDGNVSFKNSTLYSVDVTIVDKKKNDILFSGDRVIPLEFKLESE